MAATLLIAGVLMAQSATVLPEIEVTGDRVDVAYEELTQGRNAEALARLEALHSAGASDPSLLINLGTAYARAGRTHEARAVWSKAVTSAERYDVELADGRWVDSRMAAHMAGKQLDRGVVLALR